MATSPVTERKGIGTMPSAKDNKATSTAVAVREVELTPAGIIPTSVLAEAITSGTKLHVALDNDQIAAAMLARKLNATSVDELDSTGELDELAEIENRPVRVMGVGFRNSDDAYQEGSKLGVYVVLNVVTAEGENLTVGTGSLDVVVTAAKVAELDRLGKDWWVIGPAAKKTAGGFTPLNMTRAAEDSAGTPF